MLARYHMMMAVILASAAATTAQSETSCPLKDLDPDYVQRLTKEAAGDDQAAIMILADFYLKGQCFPHQPDKAIKLYQALAKQENPEAEFRLGLIYLNGFGTAKNFILANEMFQRAITHGHPQAKEFLDFLNDKGFDDC